MSDKKKFSCNQLDDNEFKKDGWRPFFECRDLGIEEATDRTFFLRTLSERYSASIW